MKRLFSHFRVGKAAVGLAVAAAVVCSGVVGAGAQAPSKPAPGGSVTARVIFDFTCMDPLNVDANPWAPPEVFDALVDLNQQGRVVPDLALHWAFSHGGKQIDFTLRQGVRFSNGDRVDARAVKASLDKELTPGANSPVKSISVRGPYVVRIALPTPFRLFMANLSANPIADVKAEVREGQDAACRNPIGSGAFKVKSVGPGFNTVTIARNPLHTWAPAWHHNKGPAYLSSVSFKLVNDDTTAVSELLSGDLDVGRVTASQLSRLSDQHAVVIHKSVEANELYLGFNHSHAPFNNLAVRRAIAQAIDRNALIAIANSGAGKPAYGPIGPGNATADPKAKSYAPKYDPSAARKVLAANHVTGPFTLVTYTIPVFAATAQYVQSALAQAGVQIKLDVKPVPDAQAQMVSGDFDMEVGIFGGDDPYTYLYSKLAPGRGIGNNDRVSDKTLDKLMVQMRTTVSQKKLTPILDQFQRYFNRQVVWVPLFSRTIFTGGRSNLHGWQYSNQGNSVVYPIFQDIYVK